MNEVKVAIIGGRDFNDYDIVNHYMQELFPDATLIISGGALGADNLAKMYAQQHNIPFELHEAKWDIFTPGCRIKTNQFGKKYNADAGFIRNTDIIESAMYVLAVWDQKSPGTNDSIEKAKALKKEMIIIDYYGKITYPN